MGAVMRRFKDTLVGRGSALDLALEKSNSEGEKIYKETTKQYEAMFNQVDRDYFASRSKMDANQLAKFNASFKLYMSNTWLELGINHIKGG